jgi:zinc protease
MRYEYYGYPEDFIFTYEQAVKNTTVEDVQRVAQTHLAPEKIVTLVVGNESTIQPPLSNLGSVITVDITIETPSSS